MKFEVLHDENYTMYAMKNYNNPHCRGIDEFHEDLNRIKYLKRLLRKYTQSGELKERLILNHLIVFYNVFGIVPATRILFSRIENDVHSILKTFMVYLNYLPEQDIPEADIKSITLDQTVVEVLRGI